MTAKAESFLREKADNHDFNNLKRDMDVLRQDISKLSSSLLSEAKAGAETVLSDVQAKSNKVVHQAEEKIGERPFLSLLVSFILGLVLAKVLEQKSR